jgi:hypothetical protein
MDDYIQINRINTQAIPGPNFAPGVTIYGGGLVAPVGGWVKYPEEQFPAPEEPADERPDANFHPMEVNTAGNMWNRTRGHHPVKIGSVYPPRRMQFPKGVTIVEAPKIKKPTYDMLLILAAVILVFLVLRSSRQ